MSFIGFDGLGCHSFVAECDGGLVWRRAKDEPILSVCGPAPSVFQAMNRAFLLELVGQNR